MTDELYQHLPRQARVRDPKESHLSNTKAFCFVLSCLVLFCFFLSQYNRGVIAQEKSMAKPAEGIPAGARRTQSFAFSLFQKLLMKKGET